MAAIQEVDATTEKKRRRQEFKRLLKTSRTAWLYIAPAVLLMLLITWFPQVYTLVCLLPITAFRILGSIYLIPRPGRNTLQLLSVWKINRAKKECEINMAHILIIAGDGSSCGHLDYAYFRMLEEGYDVTITAPVKKPLNCSVHQGEAGRYTYTERPGYIIEADAAFDDIDPSTFDALLIPGARAPEYLRNNQRCIDVTRHFLETDKPIGSICHGPGLLVGAGVTGRRMVSVDGIKQDVMVAGKVVGQGIRKRVAEKAEPINRIC